MSNEITSACPGCGAEYEDLDGFGVLHCRACGYCSHASITGGTCELCGHSEPFAERSGARPRGGVRG